MTKEKDLQKCLESLMWKDLTEKRQWSSFAKWWILYNKVKKKTFFIPSWREETFFPKGKIISRCQILAILLEAIRFIYSYKDEYDRKVQKDDASMQLYVDKTNRLYFFQKCRKYSVYFPFQIETFDDKLSFSYKGIIFDSQIISLLISVLSEMKTPEWDLIDSFSSFDGLGEFDCYEIINIFVNLCSEESGYVRYDNDETGFADAEKKGRGYLHPIHHLDVFYTEKASMKLGFNKEITEEHLIEYLNKQSIVYYKD